MGGGGTATFIKDVSRFFTGAAAMYELTPPLLLRDMDSDGNDLAIPVTHVVAANATICGIPVGTTLYRCDETGYVTSWERLQPNPIKDTVDDALRSIGYSIKEGTVE
jgi:hypothetical protein